MLGTNQKGYTKWREYYSFGKKVTLEINEYIPNTMIQIRIIEENTSNESAWIFKVSNYEEKGVLQIKHFAIIKSKLDRFIKRYIDTKYSETDYLLMSLNIYLNQLIEDQEEVLQLTPSETEELTTDSTIY